MTQVNIKDCISSCLKEKFGSRIICLLYYGSTAFQREVKDTSDYDFCLVLDRREKDDLKKIRMTTLFHPKVELTLHYLKEIEDDGWDNFHSDNHGVFYVHHFASIDAIIGENIFLRHIHLLNNNNVIESLKKQIIEYFWRMENAIFTNSDSDLIKNNLFKKYTIRILQDIMVSKGQISFREINKIDYQAFINDYLQPNKEFSEKLKSLVNKSIEEKFISSDEIIELKELLYSEYKEKLQ